MSKDATVEMSFWDKLTERLSGFSESVGKLLMRLFGDSNERYVRKLGYTAGRKPGEAAVIAAGSLIAQINEIEPRMKDLTDEQLEQAIAAIEAMLAAQACERAKVIEGEAEVVPSLPAPASGGAKPPES